MLFLLYPIPTLFRYYKLFGQFFKNSVFHFPFQNSDIIITPRIFYKPLVNISILNKVFLIVTDLMS